MILQWGSTIKVSIECHVATRHRGDTKVTLNPNKQQQPLLIWMHYSLIIATLFKFYDNYSNFLGVRKFRSFMVNLIMTKPDCTVNPHLPSGPVHPYQLEKSIFNLRGAWCTFSFRWHIKAVLSSVQDWKKKYIELKCPHSLSALFLFGFTARQDCFTHFEPCQS